MKKKTVTGRLSHAQIQTLPESKLARVWGGETPGGHATSGGSMTKDRGGAAQYSFNYGSDCADYDGNGNFVGNTYYNQTCTDYCTMAPDNPGRSNVC